MSIDRVPSSEHALGEKIKSVLRDHYIKALGVSHAEGIEVFNDFNKPEAVKAILEQQGIDTSNLQIEAGHDIKADPQPDTGGGDAFPGNRVKIRSGDKILFEEFFESPDEKYEY